MKVDTKIHHVEHWGSILQNMSGDDYSDSSSEEEDDSSSEEEDQDKVKSAGSGDDIETLKATDYFQRIAGYGKNVQKVSKSGTSIWLRSLANSVPYFLVTCFS